MPHAITKSHSSEAVAFHKFNIPDTLNPGHVTVKFLAAPINPLDMLVLADRYPVKPAHHISGNGVLGYDGVGQVTAVADDVTGLAPGDIVVPSRFGLGTWRTHAALPASALQKLSEAPKDMACAAILRITVAPAYCLVEDMAPLRPGDWIVVNAGTSAVAQMVTQFAAMRGVRVAQIVRDRPAAELAAVKNALLGLGAGLVLTESELETGDGLAQLQALSVALALDSVFGKAGRALVKALAPGGTYVQLGFLAGPNAQLALDAADLFARNLTMKAFRGTAQLGLRSPAQQRELCDWFVRLFNRGDLKLPPLGLERVDWHVADAGAAERSAKAAVETARAGALGQRKQVLVFKH
ncbi:putative mitochondrial enoyl reductase [Lasiodiplodia theobromae]|uniref:putative mitochondrial enoyl reductase n=1 Tax=Lasiodiplodia theobromae TaxID=45133 RepID=UPI0015C32DC0|nr:putative mitochondrial enoyl reductase [Lasiodiplodia theobromae]KAF4539079.1 putative mitochondrial enoyl reductase [Lasiodiplodia theobromae]